MNARVIGIFNLVTLVLVLFVCSGQELRANSESVVWDSGPTTGYPSAGFFSGEFYFTNKEGVQTIWDSVVFPEDTLISGFNLFTSPRALPLRGDFFRVRFRLDDEGLPGVTDSERVVISQDVQHVGTFATLGDPANVYQISLRFGSGPVLLTAGTTYWVGATSVGFHCGQYGVIGSGDGTMAIEGGTGQSHIHQGTDAMFQLVATVPEPTMITFLLLSLPGFLLARRARACK